MADEQIWTPDKQADIDNPQVWTPEASDAHEKAHGFLDDHPKIKAAIKGGLLDPDSSWKDKLHHLVLGDDKDNSGHPIQGPGIMQIPGIESGANKLASYVDPETNTSNPLQAFAGNVIRTTGSMIGGGLDPRTAGIKTVNPVGAINPDFNPTKLNFAQPNNNVIPQQPKLQLPAAPEPTPMARFVGGERGLADASTPNKISIGQRPELMSGTIKPAEFGEVNQVKPDIAATYSGDGNPRTQIDVPPEKLISGEVSDETNWTKPRYYTGSGDARPGEPQLPSAVKTKARVDQANPSMANGDVPKPPIETVNSIQRPETPADVVLPKGGQLEPGKDISAIGANFRSPHKILAENPQTASIAESLMKANDDKTQWIREMESNLANISKGLSKAERIELGHATEGIPSPNPEINARAEQAKQILDHVFTELPEGTGYIDRYLTHIEAQPEDWKASAKQIFDWHNITGLFKEEPLGDASGNIGDLYEKNLGDPKSPFVEHRADALQNIEYDVNKVWPAYVESIAKNVFDQPAVNGAKATLESVGDGKLKELAQWYIKNYTRYDAESGLHKAWNGFSDQIARTTARSVIAFNPGLHMLHLGEIPANIFPELGSKYTSLGVLEAAKNPFTTYQQMARKGLLQSEVRPWSFKTNMEKFDSVSYGMSAIESFVKGVAYNGALKKGLSEGLSQDAAELKALRFAKNSTLTVDAARQMKGFSPESNYIGGEFGSRVMMQFKQIPAKIVEQYMDIARQAKNNPKQAQNMLQVGRLLVGAAAAGAGTAAGLHTFHLNPMSLMKTGTFGVGDTSYKVLSSLVKGDWQTALAETAAWVTPGGTAAKRLLENGDKPKSLRFVKDLKP